MQNRTSAHHHFLLSNQSHQVQVEGWSSRLLSEPQHPAPTQIQHFPPTPLIVHKRPLHRRIRSNAGGTARGGATLSVAVRAVWGLAQGLFTTASKTDGLYLYNFSTVPLLSELLKLVRGRAPSPLCPPYTSPCRAGATCQHIKMQSCGDTGPRRCNYHSKGDLRYDRGEGCWLLVCRWCHQRCCTGITSAALAQPTSRWTGRARACTRSLPSFTWCTTTCSSSPSSAWPPPAPAPPPPPLYPRALASCSLSSESRAFPRWRCLMHCLVAAACGTQVRGSVHLPDPRQPEDRHHRHPLPPLPQT